MVNESNAIMQYLEWAYPDPPLMPEEPQLHALALQRFHELETLYNTVYPLFQMKMVAAFDPSAQLDEVCNWAIAQQAPLLAAYACRYIAKRTAFAAQYEKVPCAAAVLALPHIMLPMCHRTVCWDKSTAG